MDDDRTREFSRRTLFLAGGGIGVAALLGSLAAPGAAADADAAGMDAAGMRLAGVDPAAVPASRRFDLTQPSHDLFRHVRLHNRTVQQSFAFDNVNRRLFVAQRRDGSASGAGSLCISRLDFSGRLLGHMYLTGFGHGVSFGVDASGTTSRLWTEIEANGNGYGRRLARFDFVSGRTLTNSSSHLTRLPAVAGASEHTCTIDPVHRRLIIRYHTSAGKRFAVYALDQVTGSTLGPKLADVAQPSLGSPAPVFQGYAAYGRYVYLLTGTSYADSPTLNSRVTSVDLQTGAIRQGPVITRAGSTLSFREPEGMGVYRTAAGQDRLFLGFASGATGDRRSNLFYKNVLI
ncbi:MULTISPECIES: teichoic acid biosynthesis protein C [Actinoalloteichus]|uniref:P68 RBP/TagC-like beta-propeller domain-containing protein n=1 Tax=Actinoalloteichus fjordicus TaxID=1612552 RepID=A0AAC9LDL4_9PSEU|nr:MULTISPECIES: teichoic acid biosynthesis protein C [Actinoalloteichus]APU14369.1 hypothetical protein UA74_11545 [Actinoalloteichus fjordicus]APU20338.1 hypothetical protein UA75_11630 [Actinoalloteichus sp. GBA129-24]